MCSLFFMNGGIAAQTSYIRNSHRRRFDPPWSAGFGLEVCIQGAACPESMDNFSFSFNAVRDGLGPDYLVFNGL